MKPYHYCQNTSSKRERRQPLSFASCRGRTRTNQNATVRWTVARDGLTERNPDFIESCHPHHNTYPYLIQWYQQGQVFSFQSIVCTQCKQLDNCSQIGYTNLRQQYQHRTVKGFLSRHRCLILLLSFLYRVTPYIQSFNECNTPLFSVALYQIVQYMPTLRTEKDIGSKNPETTAVSGFCYAIF